MAPWPEQQGQQEQDTEPKAPDKTGAGTRCLGGVTVPAEPEPSAVMKTEEVDTGAACKPTEENDPGVLNLDEQGLRELLDEAIAYKNPKDREQSSALFKELLAKAEADEREHSGGQRGISVISSGRYRRGPTRKGDVSERNSRGGSLQNLVHALNSDPEVHSGLTSSRKRGGRRNPQPQVSVSARQREGGSLPCNVNADYYTAAALLRSHDDVGSSSVSVKKRDHTTPIDDVVTGNSYSYKLSSASSARTADDLSGYRVCNAGKRATGSVDDIETAAPRGTGNKRRELKKLGHSSDAIFPESISDVRSMEDLSKEAENSRFSDVKNENENVIDCATEFASYCLNRQNNVDRSCSEHTVIDLESQSQLNGPSMLGVGMNGAVRPGPDHRWMKSDPRKDDDMDGTEMTPMDRNAEMPNYASLGSNDHEVDQSIFTEFLPRKAPRSNGEHMVQLSHMFEPDYAAGESLRSSLVDTLGEAALGGDKTRARTFYQVSHLHKDVRLLRVDQMPVPSIPTYLAADKVAGKDPDKKGFDENGNALHQGSGSERKFKARKNKTDNNNYVLAEKIPGHRGDIQDINELLLFIESASNCQDAKTSVSGKNTRNTNGAVNLKESKQRNSSSNGKRSEDGGTKTKSEKRKSTEKQKLKKSNSLEEISCTKLSDLTSSDNTSSGKGERQPKKQLTLDSEDLSARDANHKTRSGSNRRSWGSEETADEELSSRSRKRKGSERDNGKRGRGSGSSSSNRKQRESSNSHQASVSLTESVESQMSSMLQGDALIGDPAEFHVVTKKQRKKKSGRSSSIGRNERSQNYAQSNIYHRENHSRRSAAVENHEGNILYHYRTAQYRSESPDHNQHQRRKSTSSMPPSDKSADSSDLDSVHSLPISSTTPRPILDKTSTSSGSTPQASYADIARMASSVSPPQGQVSSVVQSSSPQTPNQSETLSQSLAGNKWPSVGQTRPSVPLWTANVTLHPTTATSLPPSHEEGDQVSCSLISSSTKRDAMTNTVSPPESELTDCSSVGNLLSDVSYPPLCESAKSSHTVTQCVQTFISQASRTSPAISPGVTMANCVDVEDSAKRAASPAAFENVHDNSRTMTLDRPAVIILDEAETETPLNGDPELTFGFEINEMLLSGACSVSSEDEAEVKTKPSAAMKGQPSLSSVANINLDKIVAFVGRAWEDVIKELPREAGVRGRVQFYNGQ